MGLINEILSRTGDVTIFVECKTCDHLFAKLSYQEYQDQVQNRSPAEWFVEACEHYVENLEENNEKHTILIYSVFKGYSSIIRNLTGEFMAKTRNLSKQELQDQLDRLRSHVEGERDP